MKFHQIECQQAAATLLAATAANFLPILTPIKGAATASGFFYDFLCKQTVDETVLTLLTEELRRQIQQKVPLEVFTFVPTNASHFLAKSQPIQAALLAEMEETTIELLKCQNFYDIVQHEANVTVDMLREFVLYAFEKKEAYYEGLGDVSILRIHGAVFEERKALQEFKKQIAFAKANDPVIKAAAEELILLHKAEPIWLPKGLIFCEKIKEKWLQLADAQGISHIAASEMGALFFLSEQFKKKKGAPVRVGHWFCREQNLLPQECEGLFQALFCKSDIIYALVSESLFEKEFISSLQFIHELLSMIGLEFRHVFLLSKAKNKREIQEKMVFCLEQAGLQFSFEKLDVPNGSPRLEFRAKDLRAREWQLAAIEASQGMVPGSMLLSQTTVFALERILALKLERSI